MATVTHGYGNPWQRTSLLDVIRASASRRRRRVRRRHPALWCWRKWENSLVSGGETWRSWASRHSRPSRRLVRDLDRAAKSPSESLQEKLAATVSKCYSIQDEPDSCAARVVQR